MYAGNEYYWGREPNGFARSALQLLLQNPRNAELHAVDIGAGEGRDAAFFAQEGLDTLAVDVAPNGLEKALRLAEERGVELRAQQGDVNTLELEGLYDLVYSIGTIQYLSPENRRERFEHFKERTVPGGLHALFAFVDHPDLPPAPDHMADEYLYAPGELPRYYEGWEVLHSRAFVFDDDSGGVPHQHAAEECVFKKPL
jgi:cyclopropane fatty-acyl-phospholipid synthase-like methyltransferase